MPVQGVVQVLGEFAEPLAEEVSQFFFEDEGQHLQDEFSGEPQEFLLVHRVEDDVLVGGVVEEGLCESEFTRQVKDWKSCQAGQELVLPTCGQGAVATHVADGHVQQEVEETVGTVRARTWLIFSFLAL